MGESKGAPNLKLKASTVIVLVGPNNSGKSLTLREIESFCSGSNFIRNAVKDVELDFPTDLSVARQWLRVFETKPPNDRVDPSVIWLARYRFRTDSPIETTNVSIDDFNYSITNQRLERLRQILSSLYTVRLDGRTRFSLVEPRPRGDLQAQPQNHLCALFVNDKARERVRELTSEAFGLYFVIDPTGMDSFRIRMSEREPVTKTEEQALDETARNFHAKAALIEDLGDGIKTYTGLIAAILSLPHSIILVDEPEAFLHPPLAHRLGYNLSKIAQERNASLIVATHSSEFLIGCMNAINDVSVVRLTYEKSIGTARALDSIELSKIMCDPLMRSSHVLRALFSRAAVITESDADRAFYEEINRRLQSESRGIKDAIFLNAQNVGTLYKIVGPLRKIGIPAVAIADMDFLLNTPAEWQNILTACQLDKSQMEQCEKERMELTTSISRDQLKFSGLNAFQAHDKFKAEAFLKKLSDFGLFIVNVGELECWLKGLGSMAHGPKWLIDIFSKIGSADGSTNYLKPGKDDVWLFIENIDKWIESKMIFN